MSTFHEELCRTMPICTSAKMELVLCIAGIVREVPDASMRIVPVFIQRYDIIKHEYILQRLVRLTGRYQKAQYPTFFGRNTF